MIIDTTQLASLIASLTRSQGTSPKTISLPNSVHSVFEGWLQTRPNNSPTHLVELMVEKSSYVALGLALPQHEEQT